MMEQKAVPIKSPKSSRRKSKSSRVASPNICELPPIKRRRSSIRRKSLHETLKNLPNATKSPLAETPKRKRLLSPENSDTQSANNQSNISENTVDGIINKVENESAHNSALQWFGMLEKEGKEWEAMLQSYKNKEANAKEVAEEFLRTKSNTPQRPIGSLDLEKINLQVQNLDHRLTKAVKTLSRSVNYIINLKESLKNSAQSKTERAVDDLCVEMDPRDIIHNILACDKMLSEKQAADPMEVTQ